MIRHPQLGKPAAVYRYGAAGIVCRWDTPQGKEIRPAIPDGPGWDWRGLPEPRPIYRLADLHARPSAQVLIVEGEKCADVGASILPSLVVVSWAGGGRAVGKTDWAPLAGRRVAIWPDNDEPGGDAAVEVADRCLAAGAASVRVLRRPGASQAKGWDIADAAAEGWDAARILAWARERAVEFTQEDVRKWKSRGSGLSTGTNARSPEQRSSSQSATSTLTSATGPKLAMRSTSQTDDAHADQRGIHSAVVGKVVVPIRPGISISAGESLDNWRSNLILNEDGIIRPRLSQNFKWMLRCHADTDGLFQWNEIAEAVFLHRAPPWGGPHRDPWVPRRIINNDIFETTTWLERRGLTPRKSETSDTIYTVASFHTYNPVRDYLAGLVWDGCPRLAGGMWEGSTMEPLAVEYLGTPADPIFGSFMVKWHVGAVARIFHPGCQVDNMIVLESPQGRRKSSYVRAMSTVAGVEYFCDDVGDISNKDSIIRLHGCWLVEIGELARVKTADIEVTKSWVTRRSDRYRPPYEREVKDVPRHFVLAASVNPSGYGYLRDPTGNRRFWPVPIRDIDVDRIAADRDQIWAEAVHYYRAKMKWWASAEDELRVDELTGDRRAEDPLAARVASYLGDPDQTAKLMNGGITLDAVVTGIGIPVAQQSEYMAKRVAEAMKEQGLQQGKNGKRRVWRSVAAGIDGGSHDG